MKTPQKTKEQLIEELANLKHDYENLLLKDQINRKEFARAFYWHKRPRPYSGDYNEPPEPILPSWEQVWVNLGTLLAAKKFLDFEGNISELEVWREQADKNFNQLFKKEKSYFDGKDLV